MIHKTLFPLWLLGGIFLFLYSFTQVDLSLTFSQASIFQQVQKSFQYIGWFNRPLSAYLYIGIIFYLSILFIITLFAISKNKISKKSLWWIIILVAVILTPSYNAFSYDLFNYIFDARIVSHYGQNPYEFRPLDFATDPMLSFMRSTHRVYPYGPVWLGITAPITFVSHEIFALSFALFKIVGTLAFLGTAFFIGKLAAHLKMKNTNFSIALFALNPLILIEGLVSSHNEIVMMFFAVMSFYFLFTKRHTFSLMGFFISVGIKYATFIFLPIYIAKLFIKKLSDRSLMQFTIALGILAVVITSVASGQNKNPEFQPWYLLLVAPFISFSDNKFIKSLLLAVSFVVLFSYVPFLYNGSWPVQIVAIKNTLVVIGILIGIIFYYLYKTKIK